MEKKNYIFIVQVTRQLSVDIVNQFVQNGSSVELITGSVEYNYAALDPTVKVKLFNKYNNSSFANRTLSGLFFTLRCFFYLLFKSARYEIILVSTPPFIFYLGTFFNRIRKQQFHLIVWDLYPDVIVNMNVLKERNWIIRLWTKLNTRCFRRAKSIFTLGKHLSKAIQRYADVSPVIIPNWVDTSFISPMKKESNVFCEKYGLADKFVVLYSGNLGLTHDVESIVYTAKELQSEEKIKFVIIGEGSKLEMITRYVKEHALKNVLLLPYQDRAMLPFSLTSADISVVTLSKGAENVSVPSKTYYSLASGSAIFALAARESELGLLIDQYKCGYVFENYTISEISNAILQLYKDNELLTKMKNNSRSASSDFSPANARIYFNHIVNKPAHA